MKEEREVKQFSIMNDIIFKVVFGRDEETCKIVLMDLINDILDLHEGKRIKSIVYKNPFNLQEYPTDKLSVMDIKVETQNGERIDIEMQVGLDRYYRKRSLYYWTKLYDETISKAMSYKDLKKSIVINILNSNCIEESDNYHTEFQILEKNEHFVLVDDLEIHFIQLAKFDDTKNIDEMSGIEQWLTFIKDSDVDEKKEQIEKISKKKEAIKMAAEVLKSISEDELLRERVLSIEKARHDQISRECNARDEGKLEGKLEGETEKSIEIAKRLLAKGMDDSEVKEITGLTDGDLETIKNQINQG